MGYIATVIANRSRTALACIAAVPWTQRLYAVTKALSKLWQLNDQQYAGAGSSTCGIDKALTCEFDTLCANCSASSRLFRRVLAAGGSGAAFQHCMRVRLCFICSTTTQGLCDELYLVLFCVQSDPDSSLRSCAQVLLYTHLCLVGQGALMGHTWLAPLLQASVCTETL